MNISLSIIFLANVRNQKLHRIFLPTDAVVSSNHMIVPRNTLAYVRQQGRE